MIRGTDYHLHTTYLKCANETMTVEAIYRRGEELGLTSIGITDHLNTRDKLPEHEKIKHDMAVTETSLETFFGVELNLLNVEGDIPYDDGVREQLGFEFAIGGIHATYVDEWDVKRVVDIQHHHHLRFARDPLIDVVVHPWWFSGGEFQQKGFPKFDDLSVVSENYHLEFARTAKEHGTAIELNASAIFVCDWYPDRFKEQYKDYVRLLAGEGVQLSVCSDAHDIGMLGTTRVVEAVLEEIGVSDDQIWNPKKGKTWRRVHGDE
ncbi:MAG: hypothetical protein COZ06_00375 [Armatimonadetes bacterium CG_4_10_14_3_um_filter_66_18]|nr:PHP domain-containing protein [Armatimonadota bacterium]OIP02555.1 MAG: hypothetical protein AUJ96_16090 [Armatimonadetes bacterium CG2_30_66_41]PIU95773.1 MAG: hypothetical protein COS65_00785 [Armatimonadetes bacterium CG06_land_8_20_14_3_00_66_21]PIW13612.1 MAG: hypothetical protein COW34_08645 [Armatimonadetes bacterium CG17_big_fil_post_rev_8_21_14_2_50_66_6]PIX40408.1 MAG: hypothetical protein COZ57_25985 [Armatimonadetes bacterium CG_4_8_14_3_um_filter_66_20]PIY54242.1 MAG: hypotheti